MDRSGTCQQIALQDLNLNRELNFVGFTPDMFLEVGQTSKEPFLYWIDIRFMAAAERLTRSSCPSEAPSVRF